MDLESLFRNITAEGMRFRASIIPTERGHTRFIIGPPQELAISNAEFGTLVPAIQGKRVIGTYGFCDLSPGRAKFDVKSANCAFDVYVIEHMGVAPDYRGQGFGMTILEMAAAVARKEGRHLTGSPNDAAERLRRKFSKRHKGCFGYRDDEERPRLFTYLRQ